MHLWDRYRRASPTARQIAELKRMFFPTVINRLRQAGLHVRRPVRRNVLTACHLAERLLWCLGLLDTDVHGSCCSDQMDVRESIDVIMNVLEQDCFGGGIVL